MDIVIGRIPVLECLRAKRRKAHRLRLLENATAFEQLLQYASDIPVSYVSRNELDRLAKGMVHQGVVLDVEPFSVFNADTWVSGTFPPDALLVILDGVEDPHNFGAIVRSAVASGASAVIFAKDRSAPISPAAVKSAAGAMEHIDLVEAVNLVRTVKALKKEEFWIAALDERGPQLLWEVDLRGRMALIIGSEGKGIRRLVREQADFLLRIPLPGPLKTLNASVSAGIALAECLRQRQK